MANDLRLLDARLGGLEQAPFFRQEIKGYLISVREVISALQKMHSGLDQDIVRDLVSQIWSATRYLAGSVSREIPYEIVYGLEQALEGWLPGSRFLITTSYLSEVGYHFEGIYPNFYSVAEQVLGVQFESDLVQVALPHLYKHLPIHNAVLYHELGHFVDSRVGVSNTMVLLLALTSKIHPEIVQNHCSEHFADLFGSTFVGSAMSEMLEDIAPGHPDSPTHPSTKSRVNTIGSLLNSRSDKMVDTCNSALALHGYPHLTPVFSLPPVESAFDNIVPYSIRSSAEVHGLLPASRNYLINQLAAKRGLWATIDDADVTRMINDLVEKSIRNWMISERWRNVGPAP